MKPKHYSTKAREAFANSLIDTGVAIFRGVTLLVILLPATYIVKAALDGRSASVDEILSAISLDMLFIGVALLIMGIFLGVKLRDEGVRHLHEMEDKPRNEE